MQCNAMQCNAMQCNAMQCNAMSSFRFQCNGFICIGKYFNQDKWSITSLQNYLNILKNFMRFLDLRVFSIFAIFWEIISS